MRNKREEVTIFAQKKERFLCVLLIFGEGERRGSTAFVAKTSNLHISIHEIAKKLEKTEKRGQDSNFFEKRLDRGRQNEYNRNMLFFVKVKR